MCIAKLTCIAALSTVAIAGCTSVDQQACNSRVAANYLELMSLGDSHNADLNAVQRARGDLREALNVCPIPEQGLQVEMMGRWMPAELYIAADDLDWVAGNLETVRRELMPRPDAAHSAPLLHVAAGYATRPMIKLLLANGFDVNGRQFGGETPLMVSAYVNLQHGTDNSEALLEAGADVNAIADNGTTALYFAVISDNERLVALLLQRGARVHPSGPDDESIVSIARKRGIPGILALIQNAESRKLQ